ncbi:MAG: hypothetical protein Q7T97_00390 [Burkholderiaceae bacterium]|nr:hypothetical protein [Burkholderiaceae bacterium]
MFTVLYDSLAAAFAARATLLINHVLTSEPVACGRLRAHAGRSLHVRLLDWPELLPALPMLRFAITPAGLLEWRPEVPGVAASSGPEVPADLDIAVEAGNPAAALLQGLMGRRPAVSISGDSSLAADVSWVVDNLRWDLRDDVAGIVGELPARELARHATTMAAGLRNAVQALMQRATTGRDGASSQGGFGGAAQSPSPAQRPAR